MIPLLAQSLTSGWSAILIGVAGSILTGAYILGRYAQRVDHTDKVVDKAIDKPPHRPSPLPVSADLSGKVMATEVNVDWLKKSYERIEDAIKDLGTTFSAKLDAHAKISSEGQGALMRRFDEHSKASNDRFLVVSGRVDKAHKRIDKFNTDLQDTARLVNDELDHLVNPMRDRKKT